MAARQQTCPEAFSAGSPSAASIEETGQPLLAHAAWRMSLPKVPRRTAVLSLVGLAVFVLLIHVTANTGSLSSLPSVGLSCDFICWLIEADMPALPQPNGLALGLARRVSELSRLSRSSVRSGDAPARLLDRLLWPRQASIRAGHSLDLRHSDARGAVPAGMAHLAPFDRR